ncbi:MAG: hypothetical protein ACXVGH_13250 [Mycobacteriales bacterium]
MRHGRRRGTAVLLAAGALLAGCGGASHRSPEVVPAATGVALASASAGPRPPAGRSPSPTLPAARTGTASPPYRPAPATADARAQVDLVYDTWMADLSGLLGALTQPWADAVREVATPKMTTVASQAAGALLKAHDHTVGRLVDSHRVVRFHGAAATLTDCLDELHWYVVEDASGRPDPSATRGYFVGTADLVLTAGRWYVSSWNSHPQPCAP